MIKELRKETKRAAKTLGSVYQLSSQCGVPQAVLSRFINGKSMSLKNADRLAKHLKLKLGA